MACLAQPVGNAGGFSYLYLIDDTYKIVSQDYMTNILRQSEQKGKDLR